MSPQKMTKIIFQMKHIDVLYYMCVYVCTYAPDPSPHPTGMDGNNIISPYRIYLLLDSCFLVESNVDVVCWVIYILLVKLFCKLLKKKKGNDTRSLGFSTTYSCSSNEPYARRYFLTQFVKYNCILPLNFSDYLVIDYSSESNDYSSICS